MARYDPANGDIMTFDDMLENSPIAIDASLNQMIDDEINNDASLYSQDIQNDFFLDSDGDFIWNQNILAEDNGEEFWVSDEMVDARNELFPSGTPAPENMPTINTQLEHEPRQYRLPTPGVNEGHHVAVTNRVHQQNEVQRNAEPQHAPDNIHRNPVIKRGPGRPKDQNQTETAKRAEKSRNKYKKLDAAALKHGSTPIQYALQLGFKPPKDYEKAVKQFQRKATWNRDIDVNFGDYLPITAQGNRRGPKPAKPLTMDEEHEKAQDKSGVKFYLLLYSLKHLKVHADDTKYYIKFCDTIANTEKELREELQKHF